MPQLKLPKDVVADARHEAVIQLLSSQSARLWAEGKNEIATLPLKPAFIAELKRGIGLGKISQGLEHITIQLGREQKGLDALAAKTPHQSHSERISRLLLIANDGSERFYRDCDALLTRYHQRLLGCRIDLPGEELGSLLFSEPRLVRALLVFDKKAVSQLLLATVARA